MLWVSAAPVSSQGISVKDHSNLLQCGSYYGVSAINPINPVSYVFPDSIQFMLSSF